MTWERGNKHILEHHAGDYDTCVKCGCIVAKTGQARQTPCREKSLLQHKHLEVKDNPMSQAKIKEAIELLESAQRRTSVSYVYERIGQALALLRAEEPKAGEFTKELRDFGIQILTVGCLTSEQAKRLSELIVVVCRSFDRLTAELKDKCSDLDAECRVSQMLLVEVKKLKGKP